MAGDVQQIDIGPCWVKFGEEGAEKDMGYTQGGVKVNIETQTTDVEVDQETEPVISVITSRPTSVTCPFAHFNAETLHAALPGSLLYYDAAKLTTVLTGDNNDLVFTAKTGNRPGPGNDIAVEYLNPGATKAACTVAVSSVPSAKLTVISVSLKHDGSVITATSAEVKAAIEAEEDAAALVTVAHSGSDTGAGVVTAMARTALSGGKQLLIMKSAANESMMSLAKSLILHPTNRLAADKNADWWFRLASPIGKLDTTYDKTTPKLIPIEFKPYPDADQRVFYFGDPTTPIT